VRYQLVAAPRDQVVAGLHGRRLVARARRGQDRFDAQRERSGELGVVLLDSGRGLDIRC
jgi:hypothetical protein